ncbi:ABC transporter ATP-binding protein [Piscinibacter sp. HJYY11]|uniref:ABC transporter ATP-binding protein n=1 Tax=Piscinibacter sp. HJYY11 TaxID=2801333 RepID=UPI00191E0D85|nr:ABC transporter ATP-binding protein [Piscinibacter sp. HJYY11]MBL0730517.1 ABC transporter ATP-binding protein [Piscinibacter sp. HJYY11]
MSSVSVENLHIRMGAISILQDMNLQVEEGEFLVLLGPSGCGKSTLLHSIAGLIDAEDGRIVIGGQDVTWADPKDRHIGMVFQSYALYPTMNVERNMSFGLRIAGMAKAELEKRVARAAGMLQLTPLLKRKPAQLSGGQRQRVAIGRALVREAKVFLFDEPLSNLDAKLRTELRRELKQLHRDLGSTMIYVTHDQVEAMTLASRVAVMRDGRIQQIDTPARVYAEPQTMFVAGFLGSPSMNFLHGELQRRDDGVLVFVSPQLTLALPDYRFLDVPLPGTPVVLGVRHEHIDLRTGDSQAEVTLVEPMGAHQVVWLKAGEQSISVSVAVGEEPALGERVAWRPQASCVSLFDPATERRL